MRETNNNSARESGVCIGKMFLKSSFKEPLDQKS
jgi:hypothetical protein